MFLDTAYGGPAPSPRRDRQAMRDDLSDIIERAIAALDALEGDPDLEPTGDERDFSAPERWVPVDIRAANDDAEPSLGWSEDRSRRGLVCPTRIDDGEPDDFREEDDPREDEGDLEPSLGAPEAVIGMVHWMDPDGRPQEYFNGGSQIVWAAGASNDAEDGEDYGIADAGGLSEQCGEAQ